MDQQTEDMMRQPENEREAPSQYDDFLTPEDFIREDDERQGAAAKTARRIRPFALVVLLAAGLIILFLVLNATLFRVRQIGVSGLRTRDPQTIVNMSGLNTGAVSMFFGINEKAVAERIAKDWYLELEGIDRRWPNTIVLRVKERAPCANVQGQGSLYLMDEEGFVLENTGSISHTNNLPVLTGLQVRSIRVGEVITPAKQDQFEDYRLVISELLRQGCVTDIEQINVTNSEHLYLTTVTGYTADLGPSKELMAKIATMRGVAAKLMEMGRQGGMIDVSIPGQAVYSPQ